MYSKSAFSIHEKLICNQNFNFLYMKVSKKILKQAQSDIDKFQNKPMPGEGEMKNLIRLIMNMNDRNNKN